MTFIRTAWSSLVGLVVDDGLLAVMTLGAVGVIAGLSRESIMGPVDAIGWILVTLLFVALVTSVRRAVLEHAHADQVADGKRDHSGD